jgi:prephenate dehydrogenase
MTDAGFVIAAYGVILGGIGLYAAWLARRLRIARESVRRRDGDPDEAG